MAADLTDDDAPERVRAHVEEEHGRLTLLVNNAGASWRATFAEGGWENVQRHMEVNFDAVRAPDRGAAAAAARLGAQRGGERLQHRRPGVPRGQRRLLGQQVRAGRLERRAVRRGGPNGVHVGLVLPGFISTEGFPQKELTDSWMTRWAVSTPEKGAEAVFEAGVGRRPERYVPKPYGLAAAARVVVPRLTRRVMSGGGAQVMTTRTAAMDADER